MSLRRQPETDCSGSGRSVEESSSPVGTWNGV